jgi:hypothetical protein
MIDEASPLWLREHDPDLAGALLRCLPSEWIDALRLDLSRSPAGFNPWGPLVSLAKMHAGRCPPLRYPPPFDAIRKTANATRFLRAGASHWEALGRIARIRTQASSLNRDRLQFLPAGTATIRDVRAMSDRYLDFELGRELWESQKSAAPELSAIFAQVEADWRRRRSERGTPSPKPLPTWEESVGRVPWKLADHWMRGTAGVPGFAWWSARAIAQFFDLAAGVELEFPYLRKVVSRLGLRKPGEILIAEAIETPGRPLRLLSNRGEVLAELSQRPS